MIHVRDIAAGYGERVVFDGLSVLLGSRRTTVIVGPGGSGKSTLLRSLGLSTNVSPLWVRGEIHGVPDDVVFVQQKQLDASTTLRLQLEETLIADANAALLDLWDAAPEAAMSLLPALDMELASLPIGLRKLACLTTAIARPASLLLLDEPDAGLHPEERTWVIRLLRELRGHRTIVVVTHHLPLAQAAGDDVIFLEDGAVIEAAEVERFFSQPKSLRTRQFIELGC